jgi:hypothetical protein
MPSKGFSGLQKNGGQYKAKLRELRIGLQKISNGEPESLLSAFMSSKKNGMYRKSLKNILIDEKLEKLIDYVRVNHSIEQPYKQRRWISLLSPLFTRNELINRGFVVSKASFAKANKHANEFGPGIDIPEKRGRPIKATHELKSDIDKFLKKNSYPAANRSVKIDHKVIPVRHLNAGFKHLFKLFLQNYDCPIKYTTFRNNCPSYFKKPRKSTDMCGICVHGKKAMTKLNSIRLHVHRNCTDCSNNGTCEQENNSAKLPEILVLSERVKLFNQHYKLKLTQREAFKKQVANLQPGTVILVIDFKANIKLNIESPQISKSFYNQPQRSLFGVSMAYFCPRLQKVCKFYFDIFSECLAHNAYFVKTALKAVFNDAFFKKLNVEQVNIWLDNAAHFKNLELHSYFAKFISEHNFDSVNVNYFAEYHGKCWCDSRFSLITRLMKNATDIEDVFVHTTQDYIELLSTQLERVASDKGKDLETNSTQIVLHIEAELPPLQPILKNYENIKLFQNFIFNKKSIRRNFTADDSNLIKKIPIVHSTRIRKATVAKQGHPDVGVTESDIDDFFKQLQKRDHFILSVHQDLENRLVDSLTEENSLNMSVASHDDDVTVIPTVDNFHETSPPNHTHGTRSKSGISKKRLRSDDENLEPEPDVSRPLKRRRIILKEAASFNSTQYVDILNVRSKRCTKKTKVTKRVIVPSRLNSKKRGENENLANEPMEGVTSMLYECVPMDIERWDCNQLEEFPAREIHF